MKTVVDREPGKAYRVGMDNLPTPATRETVSLPVVCSRCKATIGTKPGFPAHLAGSVSHGICATCLPVFRAEMGR